MLDALMDKYGSSPELNRISELIAQGAANLQLKGLSGSLDRFVVSGIFKQSNYNHLVVLNDKEEAAYFQNDLKRLLPGKDVLLLPDSYKRPQKFDEIDATNVLYRTEAVNRISNPNSKAEIVVSYPEALFEKVVRSKVLSKNTLHLGVNEKVDVDFIIELLVTYEFERVDFVYEPGQFSVRGDIVDIFSYANDYPYRVELFDNEVESIRTFDPISQRSEKKIAKITIVPNIQTHFSIDEKGSLSEFLPPKTIVWARDLNILNDTVAACLEKAHKMKADENVLFAEDNPLGRLEPEEVFNNPADIVDQLRAKTLVQMGQHPYFPPDEIIEFNSRPQPAFNKKFDLLIEDLNKRQKDGYELMLFADNTRQFERFENIFTDLDAEVRFQPVPIAIHEGFIDHNLKLVCYTDHQIFNRFHKYRVMRGFSKDKALLLKQLKELQPGDFITHIDHGVGEYSGLEKIEVNGRTQEAVRIIYAGGDLLYVNINSLHKISKYSGKDGIKPRVNKLGSDNWARLKKKTKKKIKELAYDLIKLYARRKSQKGFAFTPDTYLQTELEASFIYEDTPDQEKATADLKKDMEVDSPMDRLICGDVGFGKTEVAIRAAFKAVCDSKQVVVLVPTTILAHQHYRTFTERLAGFPVNIDYVNRFRSSKDKKEIVKKVAEGQIDILIGTHSIVGKLFNYKDLGLLVIDEEQKFGVAVKDKLKNLRATVDTLTLTATPIPRTLQFSLMGARDLSVINTPPPNRQPVTTEVHVLNPEVIKDAIEYEVYRGGQVFFVHNRIKDIAQVKAMLQNILSNIEIGVAHGQMPGDELEQQMMAFINREYDVLLCTNIIESGLDIPNSNTIIINNAHWFGMSDLHQMRGRVGRSNKKAFCYLVAPPLHTLTKEARERLKTLEQFSELGSGFQIAMKDLDIRGAGNLLGAEQSGFIAEVGYDMYHKILDETIQELKETEFAELYEQELQGRDFLRDCQIDTDQEMHIPGEYIKNTAERLSLYTKLNEVRNEEELTEFRSELVDRFGPIPLEVHELFNSIRLKWLCVKLGMEKVNLKNGKLRIIFIENQDSAFYLSPLFGNIISYVQQHPNELQLKHTPKRLILQLDGIRNAEAALSKLGEIKNYCDQQSPSLAG